LELEVGVNKSHATVKYVLQLAAITTLAIGLVTLFAPTQIVSWFDGYDAPNNHMVRFIGTALIGFAVSNWLYSRADDYTQVLPAIYGNIASLVLAIAVDLVGIFQGTLTKAAWLILMLHVIFAAAFLYCVFVIRQSERDSPNKR
jgi:hypothetical protein